MVAVMMSVLVVSSGRAATAQETDAGIWGDPEISSAVEKVRKGENADLRRLTSKADPGSSWKPVKKNLSAYHDCLGTNENPRVQFFAIAAISRLKDKSSVLPLQTFIVTAQHRLQEGTVSLEEENRDSAKAAQRRQKGGLLSREESVMLQRSLGVAIETLGEIDGDTDISVAFLGSLLKHDMPKEWGGAVAHSRLARKGLPGLRRLLEASLTADEKQIDYVISAISEIRDPTLVDALYTACLNVKYPFNARFSALCAIASMRAISPQAEQLVIDILMNENSDLRRAAVCRVGEFGTEKAFKLLRDLRAAPGKGGPELVQYIDDTLMENNLEDMIDGVAKTILSPTISDEEKLRLCSIIESIKKDQVARCAATLIPCLNVENTDKEPLNKARISIWLALYRSTKVEHPLTLIFTDDKNLQHVTFDMRSELAGSLSPEKYRFKERDEITHARIKTFVTKWDKGNADKKGGGK
jgi:HEAT repeat protein